MSFVCVDLCVHTVMYRHAACMSLLISVVIIVSITVFIVILLIVIDVVHHPQCMPVTIHTLSRDMRPDLHLLVSTCMHTGVCTVYYISVT